MSVAWCEVFIEQPLALPCLLIKCWSKRQDGGGVRAGIFLHLDVVMLSGQGQVGASVITHTTGWAACLLSGVALKEISRFILIECWCYKAVYPVGTLP